MRRVLAAVDVDEAAEPVTAFAGQLARVLDAVPDIVHAGPSVDGLPRGTRAIGGEAGSALIGEARDPDVVSVVLGLGSPSADEPVGGVATRLLLTLPQPIAVVPAEAAHAERLSRAVVPLEGSQSTTLAPLRMIKLATDSGVDIILIHVFGADSLPLFTDQPQHEVDAWTREFIARYCPLPPHSARLVLRTGEVDLEVCALAQETEADLVALGWSQELAPGRARFVQAVLRNAKLPVLLIPVKRIDGPTHKERAVTLR
jgi:hypothetical protein